MAESVLRTFIDTKAPTDLKLKLARRPASPDGRNVTLEIRPKDGTSGVELMRFSNYGTEYSAWEPFDARKAWTLAPGDGPKIVLVRVRDRAGNEALPVSATIEPGSDGGGEHLAAGPCSSDSIGCDGGRARCP